jgi:tRNA threonylcarbamoyl adenosine modification protein YeaZ
VTPSGPALLLATSGPAGEVGLLLPSGEVRVQPLGTGAARGRGLLPAVAALLAGTGAAPGDLAWIAVDVGPGSFTGVRVGVTAAKTLAWALRVPVAGVTSLECLAAAAPGGAPVLAVRDAGRETVYAALFGPGVPGRREVLRAPARLPGPALRSWPPDALLAGEEAPVLAARFALPQRPAVLTADVHAVRAVAAVRRVTAAAADPATLVPLYLQASTAERRRAGEVPQGS